MKVRFWAFLLPWLAILLTACISTPDGPQTNVSLSTAIALSKSHNIQKVLVHQDLDRMVITVAVSGTSLAIQDVNGTEVAIQNGSQVYTIIGSLTIADLQSLGFELPREFATASASITPAWISYLPLILVAVLLIFLIRAGRGVPGQAMNYGHSRARLATTGNTPSVTFNDVAGVEEAKQDLQEVVDFLKHRAKFQALGARIPRGVLLIGPPGTGKTLLARAVAGEAGVPFFSISGSEFVEMFVGVGAARVRDLFDQAKRSAPCIVFIDEIDAVGRQRGVSVTTSHDEREQTLNQILTEMDGFTPNIGVIVLAATNRPDVLDPALLRPGRFDRRISLDLPDIAGRFAILKVHSHGKPMTTEVDLEVLAKETHGFSGADLANLLNEGAILAARRDKTAIGMSELEESIDRVIAGPERRSLKISPKDKETTAFHEAGHALVARLLPGADPVHKVSIVARGSMGGYTRILAEDRYIMTRSQFNDTLATLLAGHSAEEMVFGETSTGPHNDIRQATALARRMVTQYGMSESLVLRTFGGQDSGGYTRFPGYERDYSEEAARQIDEEVAKIIKTAHGTTRRTLEQHKARLVYLARKLIEKETLEGPDLEAAFTDPIPEAVSK